MNRYRLFLKLRWVLFLALVLLLVLSAWVQWGAWPQPIQGEIFDDADALVVLGGGDNARWQHALALSSAYPSVPVIVTGDGDLIVDHLLANGMAADRILHETSATSTVENAIFTRGILTELGAQKVILVTNWFHSPRSERIFERYQPERNFCVSFSPKPDPMQAWDVSAQRRERLAAIHNFLLHGVWSW